MKVNYTPYSEIITIPTICGGVLELSVSARSKTDCKVYINISHSTSKWAIIAVDSKLFCEEILSDMTHKNTHLDEKLMITRKGLVWVVTSYWGEEISTYMIDHLNLVKLCKHFSYKESIYHKCNTKFGLSIKGKLMNKINLLFNLPRKIINW